MAFLTQTLLNLNTNVQGATTNSIDVTAQTILGWRIISKSGSHNIHKIALQFSFDNQNWSASGSRVKGSDVTSIKSNIAVGYIRFRVTIVEGSTSTVDIIVNAK